MARKKSSTVSQASDTTSSSSENGSNNYEFKRRQTSKKAEVSISTPKKRTRHGGRKNVFQKFGEECDSYGAQNYVQHRTCSKTFVDFFRNLPMREEHIEILRETPFFLLMNLPVINVPRRLLHTIVEAWEGDRKFDELNAQNRTTEAPYRCYFARVVGQALLKGTPKKSKDESKRHCINHLKPLPQPQLDTLERMYFAVFTTALAHHWVLLEANFSDRKFYIYDSLKGNKQHMKEAKRMASWIAFYVDLYIADYNEIEKWPVVEASCPQQYGGADCGIFVIKCAECLSLKKPFDYDQAQMPRIRAEVAARLLKMRRLSNHH